MQLVAKTDAEQRRPAPPSVPPPSGSSASQLNLDRLAPTWPALLALAAIAVLSIVAISVGTMLAQRTVDRAATLVDDELRSIELVDDLRHQAHRAARPGLTAQERADIARHIGADTAAYTPLAMDPGEAETFARLQRQLDELESSENASRDSALISATDETIAELIAINEAGAREHQAGIRAAQRKAVIVEALLASTTLGLVAAVAVALARSHARRRRAIERRLADVDDRSRELEAFAARAAHDLRGPLAPIFGYATMLANGQIESGLAAPKIQRAASRMTDIIDDLLALSVIGQTREGSTSVQPVVRELLEEFAKDLTSAHVEVDVPDCRVACAQSVLTQLVQNLISNAIKYRSPKRPLELRIQCSDHALLEAPSEAPQSAREAASGSARDDYVSLTVADNGTGMSPESVSHAFEAFYRAAPQIAPGTGLGLAIVKRAVEALGGQCKLSSKLDEGTQVSLVLPAAARR